MEAPGTSTTQTAEWSDVAAAIRRAVARRVADPTLREDLAQETVARLLKKRPSLTGDELIKYAVVSARNLIATRAQTDERQRRNRHRLWNPTFPERPDEVAVRNEESEALSAALSQVSPLEREVVWAHEVFGEGTRSLGTTLDMTPGAVAVRLARTRAKLRVEYLIALQRQAPPTLACKRVLAALSSRDRRRQIRFGATAHVAHCDYCARLETALVNRDRAR